jgi:hypothetical protein
LVVKSCFVDDVADAARMEMALHVQASEDIVEVGGNTWVAEVGMLADHTSPDHADHGQKAKQLMQESWIAGCGKRWEGTALLSSESQP